MSEEQGIKCNWLATLTSKDDWRRRLSSGWLEIKRRHRLLYFIAGVFLLITLSVIGYARKARQADIARVAAEIALREAQISRQLQEESQAQSEREKEELRKEAERREWEASSVQCPKCSSRFLPEENKAPFWGAVTAGTAGGAAVGAAGGAWAGAGTGVAVGGVGAFPGYLIGGAVGGLGGGIVGGVGSAWHRDRQVKCPDCGKVFRNPKN